MYVHTLWVLAALSVSAVEAQAVSRTARCGPRFGLTCQGSQWGNCCSQYGYCGITADYCGRGCQKGWGSCNPTSVISSASRSLTTLVRSSSTQTSSSALPSQTLKVTTNARCGKGFGFTCQGSQWGDCCSQYSYCGLTTAYCGKGCQKGFGKCNGASSSSSSVATSSAPSSTSSIPSSSSSSSVATSSALSSSSSIPSSSSTSLSVTTTSEAPSIVSATPPSCEPVNLFANPGFETGSITPWEVGGNTLPYVSSAVVTTDGHDSANYLAVTKIQNAPGALGYSVAQIVTFATEVQAELSVWLRVTALSNAAEVRFNFYMDNAGFGNRMTTLSGGEGWVQHTSGVYTIPAGTHTFLLQGAFGSFGPDGTRADNDDFLIRIVSPAPILPSGCSVSSSIVSSSTAESSTATETSSSTSSLVETSTSVESSSTLASSTTPPAPICTPAGGPCDLFRPDLCCNFICFNDPVQPYCG